MVSLFFYGACFAKRTVAFSSLQVIKDIVNDINLAGITSDNIYFLGFSQGACLTLEYVARNAIRYGGVVAFTGGLIGETIRSENYTGDFNDTPLFIGSSNPDPACAC